MFVKIVTAYLNRFLHVNKSNTLKSESVVFFNYVLNYYPNRLILFHFYDSASIQVHKCMYDKFTFRKKQCVVKFNLSNQYEVRRRNCLKKNLNASI